MAGIQIEKPFPLYPHGFPPEIMDEFERRIGRRALGNYAASGTEIIQDLGAQHLATGLADRLHLGGQRLPGGRPRGRPSRSPSWTASARRRGDSARAAPGWPGHRRPFVGRPGAFTRDNAGRHDYAVAPPRACCWTGWRRAAFPSSPSQDLRHLPGPRISHSEKARGNADGMAKTLDAMSRPADGLIFTNLVDFDALYGHRNGRGRLRRGAGGVGCLAAIALERLREDDLVIFTADHGNDPTTPSTDHSREYVAAVGLRTEGRPGRNLGTRSSLADIGRTIAQVFDVDLEKGTSFWT